MTILIIAEHDNKKVRATTLTTLAAALEITTEIDVFVCGDNCQTVVDELKKYAQINTILISDNTAYAHQLAENTSAIIASIAKNYTHIFAPATTFGKNILPRVAALMDLGQVSDIISIIDNKTYKRPIYAGNAIATVESLDAIQLVTIRPSAFDLALPQDGEVALKTVETIIKSEQTEFISDDKKTTDRPELGSADTVISGGRGLGDKQAFDRLTAIAEKMGAAIGASRAAVDGGLAPNDYQVGQTGQIVSPKLYIAIGISGAIQHLAGMKDSDVVVAINKDPDAPIFEIADFGLVADLDAILPEWEAFLVAGD